MNPESERCLLCKKAKCAIACPVHTDVPKFMEMYRQGRKDEAAAMLFANNPFSAITCKICDWHKTCYGHCILNSRKVPVKWYEIEEELSENYLLESASVVQGADNGKSVAVIGGGPAGITAALKLREAGCKVDLYESSPRIGGILRYGIPRFRLDEKFADAYERLTFDAGVNVHCNVTVGRNGISIDSLRESHDAVFVASGAALPRRLDIPGEDGENVIYALDYLKNPASYSLGKRVLVIGGGNVTMDAARTARRQGHETWVYYRKTFENMPANIEEVNAARDEGVKFVLFEVPVEVKGNTAVMKKCRNIIRDDGRLSSQMIEGTEHEVAFDTMIVAVSANVDYTIFGDNAPALTSGWISADEFNRTSFPDVFVGGDFLLGPQTVVEAVQSAKLAVYGILSDF